MLNKKSLKFKRVRPKASKATESRTKLKKVNRKVERINKILPTQKSKAFIDVAIEKPNEYIEKLYFVSEDLYFRDIVETKHAVNSGTTSIKKLKIKYAKYIK